MTGDGVTITIPLPPRECGQNARVHHMVRARANRTYRNEAFAMAFGAWAHHGTLESPVTVEATVFCGADASERIAGRRYRPRDVQNAIGALKPAIDGCVDAKLIAGDDWRHLRWGSVTIVPRRECRRACVELTFRPSGGQ